MILTPADIAEALTGHPGIRGSRAVAHTDARGETIMLAYVSMDPQDRTSHGDLREYLRSRFPECSVPVVFVRLDRLPPLDTVRRAA